jgi:hypothetical protein
MRRVRGATFEDRSHGKETAQGDTAIAAAAEVADGMEALPGLRANPEAIRTGRAGQTSPAKETSSLVSRGIPINHVRLETPIRIVIQGRTPATVPRPRGVEQGMRTRPAESVGRASTVARTAPEAIRLDATAIVAAAGGDAAGREAGRATAAPATMAPEATPGKAGAPDRATRAPATAARVPVLPAVDKAENRATR